MPTEFSVTEVKFAYKRNYLPGRDFRQSSRSHFGLVFVLSGALTLWQKDCRISLPADSILLLQPQDKYRLINEGEEASQYIVISYRAAPADALASLLPRWVFHSTRPQRFRDLFESVFQKSTVRSPCAQAQLCASVQDILCRIISEHYRNALTEQNRYAQAALFFMENNFSRNISSLEIAQAVGVSASHLRSLFKKEYGVSLIQQLNSIRIQQAKTLLSSGMFTLAEIATACGFQNEYYFSRVFKQFVGISPGKY